MKLIKTIVLTISAIFLLSFNATAKEENASKANSSKEQNQSAQLPKKEEYPKFVLKDLNGNSYEIQAVKWGLTFPSLKDKKAVAVLMFGEHCPPCLKEIPNLVEVKNKYKKEFEILALQVQDKVDKKSLEKLIKEHKINYPIIQGRKFMDFIYYFAKKSGWLGSVPYILIFDKEGHVRFSNLGYTDKEALEQGVKEALKTQTKK